MGETILKYLIDNNLTLESGNKANTYIEYFEQPSVVQIADPDVLLLELGLNPLVEGINGFKLTEEEILPDGSIKISQEFLFAPDIAYSLFVHWKEIDKTSKEENG
jgi:hypothetical protein